MSYNRQERIGEDMDIKKCLLNDDKTCTECGECTRCDLNPDKLCDNCMKCIDTGADYSAIEIDEIFEGEDDNGN